MSLTNRNFILSQLICIIEQMGNVVIHYKMCKVNKKNLTSKLQKLKKIWIIIIHRSYYIYHPLDTNIFQITVQKQLS